MSKHSFPVLFLIFAGVALFFFPETLPGKNFGERAASPPSLAAANVASPEPLFDVPWLTFNTSVAADTGSPVGLATGDIDGDGDIDVVAPRNYLGGGGFVFLRNEGNGRFAQPVNLAGSSRAAGIALADLNGDGKLDIAISDGDGLAFGNSLSIYVGNGDGTFGARRVVSLGSGRIAPVGIATLDADVDGDVDLAVACDAVGAVMLLRNNGDATFAAPVSMAAGMYPDDVAAGDLNGDGRADLVVAHREYRVSVLMNNGAGGFAPATGYDNLTSGTNWAGPLFPCVALADLDRDGKLDVLYGSTRTWDGNTGQIVQLRNSGGGALARNADIPMVLYTAGPTDIAVADMNGDGASDILATSYDGRASDGFCVIMNNGAGTFGPAALYAAGQSTIAVGAADLNGDGKLDVLTADDYSDAVAVRYNPGNGIFKIIPQDFAGSAQFFQDAADIDGDGDLDVFTSGPHPSADDGAIMRNNGAGRFTSRTVIHNGQDGVAAGVLRDLNGDGKPDLLFNNANTAPRYDFFTALNDGHGNFGPVTRWLVGSAGWGGIDAFDIDNDGDLDVIDCEAEGAPGIPNGRFFIALNNGDGTFQTPYAYDQLPARPDSVTAGDFNHDGKLDLAFANTGAYGFDDGMFVVRGNGNGTFQPPLVYHAGRGPAYIVTADFNHDGHLDIATLNSGYNGEGDETLSIFLGVGNGNFSQTDPQYAPYSPDLLGASGLTVGDIDGDGDLDILTTGVSNDVAMFLNNGAGAFTFPYRLGAIAGAHAVIYRDFTGDGVADLALLTSPPPIGFDGGVAVIRGSSPLAAQSAVSRKFHGGIPFDLNLPLTGGPAVEPRRGSGPNFDMHQLLVTFGMPVTVEGVSIVSSNGGATATRTVNGNLVTIDLAGVANAQTVLVTLNNVSNGTISRDISVPVAFLFGDTNGNGIVNASDVSQTKSQNGQGITASNFRVDVNANGLINASDAGAVKAQVGNSLP